LQRPQKNRHVTPQLNSALGYLKEQCDEYGNAVMRPENINEDFL